MDGKTKRQGLQEALILGTLPKAGRQGHQKLTSFYILPLIYTLIFL